jgi:hypothetical protein
MGELWHTLSEDEKEDYRRRAREIGDTKLREWQQKVKDYQGLTGQVGVVFKATTYSLAISQLMAPVSLVADGDDTIRPRLQGGRSF